MLNSLREPPYGPKLSERIGGRAWPTRGQEVLRIFVETQQNIAKVSRERHTIHDPRVAVLKQFIRRHSDFLQSVAYFSHQGIHTLTEDAINFLPVEPPKKTPQYSRLS